jgi:hypothetical protein
MIGLFITMVTVFVGYVATIWSLYGVLPSISESFYRLPQKYNFIFTLALWGFASPAMIIGTPVTGLMFFATAGIMFVGAAAAFKQKLTKTVHIVGASVGMGFSQIAIATSFGLWPITAISVLLISLIFLFRKYINYTHVWWIEIICFTAISITYGLYLFA